MRVKGITPHVWSRDPALDRGTTEEDSDAARAAYVNFISTGDRTGLVLRKDRTPVVWSLRSLSMRAWDEVSFAAESDVVKLVARLRAGGISSRLLEQGTYRTYAEAARRGIVAVEGATDEKGKPISKLATEKHGDDTILTDACLEMLFDLFGPRLIGELGARILELSDLDPT
jgi:hypothetical protein